MQTPIQRIQRVIDATGIYIISMLHSYRSRLGVVDVMVTDTGGIGPFLVSKFGDGGAGLVDVWPAETVGSAFSLASALRGGAEDEAVLGMAMESEAPADRLRRGVIPALMVRSRNIGYIEPSIGRTDVWRWCWCGGWRQTVVDPALISPRQVCATWVSMWDYLTNSNTLILSNPVFDSMIKCMPSPGWMAKAGVISTFSYERLKVRVGLLREEGRLTQRRSEQVLGFSWKQPWIMNKERELTSVAATPDLGSL